MGCGSSSPLPTRGDSHLRVQNVITSGSSSRLSLEGKIVLLGDSGVGKSSLALRFCRGRFPLYHEVTIGAAFLQQTVRLDSEGNQLKLYIWDTGGQERFRAMAPLYYRDAAGAVVVYDATSPSSLEAVKFWTNELRQHLDRCSITVAANKCDLMSSNIDAQPQKKVEAGQKSTEADVVVDQERVEALNGIEEVRNFCARHHFTFIQCSAKTGFNVNLLFEHLARDVFSHLKEVFPPDM